MNQVSLREYDYLIVGKKGEENTNGKRHAVCISQAVYDYLSRLLVNEEANDFSNDHGLFLKRSSWHGNPAFQMQSYVGVLQTPCGTQIEVLPKISDKSVDGVKQSQLVLLRMLRYLKSAKFKVGGDAQLNKAPMHLLELFMAYFLKEVNMLVKHGVRSDYVTRNENQVFLKGKLLVNQQIRVNAMQQQYFFCAYDEYEPNRPENRLIHRALEKVSRLTRNVNNQRLSRELMFVFADVPISKDVRQDFSKCRNNQVMAHYQHPLEWCRLILHEESTVPLAGKTQSISILFSMEKIFEDYVAAMLRKYLPSDFRISTQHSGKTLSIKPKMFKLRPDIVIKQKDNLWVADTKWKVLDEKDTNHGISQGDMYQLYAYGKKYEGCNGLFLIYPKGNHFKNSKQFIFDEKSILQCLPFDCETQDKKAHIDMEQYLQS
ncbi:MAG: McrC family protein [Mariprofundales bacterium]